MTPYHSVLSLPAPIDGRGACDAKGLIADPRVQIVIQMDGWGNPELKKGSYVNFVYSEPVQFTGFKIFYKNDTKKKGWQLMKPADVLSLHHRPLYIQYQ